MSETVTVSAPEGKNPATYPCTVGSAKVSIVVSAATLAAVPETEQDAYVQARALLLAGDAAGAESIVTPLASGNADAPNWADQWLAGNVIS